MTKTDFAELKEKLFQQSYTQTTAIITELLEIIQENNKCLFYYKEIIEEQLSAGAYLRQTIDQTTTRLQKLRDGK